jgi:uncharacterized membrane protein
MDVHSNSALSALVILLSLAGLSDALYFTFAYYGRIKKARWVPEILCAREGSSCVTVVQTPYARVFGVPNSVLGLFYYALLMGWTLGGRRIAERVPWMTWALIVISGLTVALGAYLIGALRRRLHVDCPLCYTAHAINAALFVLLILLERP